MEGGHETLEVQSEPDLNKNATSMIDVSGSEELNVKAEPNVADARSTKLQHLRSLLEKDPRSADIKWSLFVAATQSYRYDSILKPFPHAFLKENNVKDIDNLLRVIEDSPPLSLLLHQINDQNVGEVPDHVIDLLHWVTVSLREPYLKTIEKESHDSVLSRVPSESPIPKPSFIFQLISSNRSVGETRWKNNARGFKTVFAYHGSKLENFHSIIHYGLQQHLNKNSLFGKGIYLSSELSVSLPYSPSGFAWGGSKCGSELSCIALCELIDNPEFVKCQDPKPDESGRSRAKVTDSMGGDVPNKYYVVSNSDMVRIRYLLIYANSSLKKKQDDSVRSWFMKHKLFTFLIGYGVLLSAIGVVKNDLGQYYYHMMLKKVGL